jgi:propionate CoA-transferase
MQVVSAREAVSHLADEASVVVSGNGSLLQPEALLTALEARYRESGHPQGLTVIYPVVVGTGPGTGVDHLADPGMVRRVFGSCFDIWHVSRLTDLIRTGAVEAHCIPMGVLFHLLRARAADQPGILTSVGLDTFVDPTVKGTLYSGGDSGRYRPSWSQRLEIDGQPYLYFPTPPVTAALLVASMADEAGNLSLWREPIRQAALDMALAAKAGGGPVIAQVRHLVRRGALPARMVDVPGFLVDWVVVEPEQKQCSLTDYDPSLSGEWPTPISDPPLPLTIEKAMMRRVALFLQAGQVINLGFGVPALLPRILVEEGVTDLITATVEHGPVGGMPLGVEAFGAARNPTFLFTSPDIFALYHSHQLDVAVLSAAEVDASGSANVSRFGTQLPGPGGYIDISSPARFLVLVSRMTTGGTRYHIQNGRLRIATEGKIQKFVPAVEERTFSGPAAVQKGTRVVYVTDRATFELVDGQVTLTELAPGIDLQRDVLSQMGFRPAIAPKLGTWPSEVLSPPPLNLRQRWLRGDG